MADMSREQAKAIIKSVTGLNADDPNALQVALELSEALWRAVSVLSPIEGEPCIESD